MFSAAGPAAQTNRPMETKKVRSAGEAEVLRGNGTVPNRPRKEQQILFSGIVFPAKPGPPICVLQNGQYSREQITPANIEH
jgi:hypothetical protein